MPPLQGRTQEFVKILETLSPSDIINSGGDLSARFAAFLERGSLDDCWRLIPQTHKAAIANQHGWNIASSDHSLSEPPRKRHRGKNKPCGTRAQQDATVSNSTAASKPPISRCSPPDTALPTPAPPCQQPPLAPDAFFKQKGCDEEKSGCLTRVCRAIVVAEPLPESSYEKMWSVRKEPFERAESAIDRLSCLQRGRQSLDRHIAEYSFIRALALLFLRHEVDHYSNTQPDLKLRPGCSRKTASIEILAKGLQTKLGTFRRDYKNAKVYFRWMQMLGLGSLFYLGHVYGSIWETKLNQRDLSLMAEYITVYHPKLYKNFRSSDVPVARCIILGLVAYGWTFSEIHSSETPLIIQIKRYVQIPEHTGPIVAINNDQQWDEERSGVNGAYQTTSGKSYTAQPSIPLRENGNHYSSVPRNSPSQGDSSRCVQTLISAQVESNAESLHPKQQTPIAMTDRVVGIDQAGTVVSSDNLQLQITSSSAHDIMLNLNVENRPDVFVGQETPIGQVQLTPKDLLFQMQTPNPDTTYVDSFETDGFFQSFFRDDSVGPGHTNSLYT